MLATQSLYIHTIQQFKRKLTKLTKKLSVGVTWPPYSPLPLVAPARVIVRPPIIFFLMIIIVITVPIFLLRVIVIIPVIGPGRPPAMVATTMVEPMAMVEERLVSHPQKKPQLEKPTEEEEADNCDERKDAGSYVTVGPPLPGEKSLLVESMFSRYLHRQCQVLHVLARVAPN